MYLVGTLAFSFVFYGLLFFFMSKKNRDTIFKDIPKKYVSKKYIIKKEFYFIPFISNKNREKFIEQLFYIPLGPSGRTLIHYFVRYSEWYDKSLRKLLVRFPNLNITIGTMIDNWSPIHNAIYFKDVNVVNLLLSSGAKINNTPMSINNALKSDNLFDFIQKINLQHINKIENLLYEYLESPEVLLNEPDYDFIYSLGFHTYSLLEILTQNIDRIYTNSRDAPSIHCKKKRNKVNLQNLLNIY